MPYRIVVFPEFADWLDSVRDAKTRARLVARLKRLERGLLGDVAPVGEGVFELREHYGPGWRMYFVQPGKAVIVLVLGGTKRTQAKDIKRARSLARHLED